MNAATNYDFDLTHDGTSTVLDSGSDNPIGVNLMIGDHFNYNVAAQGNDFWIVDTGGFFFPLLSFMTLDSGIRTADFSLSLWLDGAQQFFTSEVGVTNAFGHFGTNSID